MDAGPIDYFTTGTKCLPKPKMSPDEILMLFCLVPIFEINDIGKEGTP